MEFKQALFDFSGKKHASGVSSGTAGLHLCVCAAGIYAGDNVITTPFFFVASAKLIMFENAVPVFVDVDVRNGNINPELVADAAKNIQKKLPRRLPPVTRHPSHAPLIAILPVDMFGQCVNLDSICKIALEYGLIVIEDSCEALGAEYKGNKAGKLGDYSVHAFYPKKQITNGKGGVIVTDDGQAADFKCTLRNTRRAVSDTWLQHSYPGYNHNLDKMPAALGAAQMAQLDELLKKREQVAAWYTERLAEMPEVKMPVSEAFSTRMSWFLYVATFDRHINRDKLANALEEYGVPVRPFFATIHLQPYLVKRFGYHPGDFPVMEDLGLRGLALLFSGVMSEAQVEHVRQTLRAVLRGE